MCGKGVDIWATKSQQTMVEDCSEFDLPSFGVAIGEYEV